MTGPSTRELDLVLVGATGFVGRLTAAHLAEHAPADLRIGLAGRSSQRLRDTRAGLPAAARNWPLTTVDVTDAAAAADLVPRTRVLVSTVGPYLRYGLPLVQACAGAGTDYADLTGETLFVHRSIAAAHELAQASGARIVHSCGLDAIPSDLGVGLTAARAAADGEGALTEAVLHLRIARGGISGGTIDSLRQQIIESQTDQRVRRLSADPRALTGEPAGAHPRRRRRPPLSVRRDRDTGRYQAPFAMGGFNRQIVFRSNALAGWAYGRGLRYREVVDTGRGPLGAVAAAAISIGSTAIMAGMWFRGTRAVLDRVLPSPGDGPDQRTRRAGRFRMEVEAMTTTGARYRTTIGADKDPGYDGTAVMLGESALCLASHGEAPGVGGVLTPMTALGEPLARRLRERGFTVTTERLAVP